MSNENKKVMGGKFGEIILDNSMFSIETLSNYTEAWRMRELYVNDINVFVGIYRGSMRIKHLNNAMRRGAECVGYSINNHRNEDVADSFMRSFDHSLSKALAFLDEQTYPDRGGFKWGEFTIYRDTTPGVRSFSPLPAALANIKPLKEIPKKWTLAHVYRLIINGQFRNLRRDVDREGEITNYLKFVGEIMASPDGWWLSYGNDNSLSISCYSFKYNSLIVDLDGYNQQRGKHEQ